jgi:hypothetical protein
MVNLRGSGGQGPAPAAEQMLVGQRRPAYGQGAAREVCVCLYRHIGNGLYRAGMMCNP